MATYSARVSVGGDDAEERRNGSAAIVNQSSYFWIRNHTFDTSDRDAGWRFTSVTVPNGATINSCTITFDNASANDDDIYADFHFEDVDDAGAFSAVDGDVSDRAKTTSEVAWQADGLGPGTAQSPDLSGPCQEVVDRAGWASGNAMVVLHVPDANPAADKDYLGESYESDSAEAALLQITHGAVAANPKGPLGHPLHGPLGGPVG